MYRFLSGVLLFAVAFLIHVPSAAWACSSQMQVPTAICGKAARPGEGYFRVNDRFFKVPAEFTPGFAPMDMKAWPRPRPRDIFETGGGLTIHALWDSMEPTCAYVRRHKDKMDVDNLYSLYHYPVTNIRTSCTGYAKDGPYIKEFITRPLVLKLHQIRDRKGWDPSANAYQRKLAKEVEHYIKSSQYSDDVKFQVINTVDGYNAYMLDSTGKLENESFQQNLARSRKVAQERKIISWSPLKSLFFIRQDSSVDDTLMLECKYRHDVEKITIPNTLSEYDMCELTFYSEKEGLFYTAHLHGKHIGFDGKKLDIDPVIAKIETFIQRFSIPADDPGLSALIKERRAQNDRDLLAGVFGPPLANAAFQKRPDLVKTILEGGADPNDGYALRSAIKDNYRNTDPEDVFKTVKLLLEAGASIEKADINDERCTNVQGCPRGYLQPLLCVAASRGLEKTVKLLLEYGADAKQEITYGASRRNILHCAVNPSQDVNYQALQHLLDAGADPYYLDNQGMSILNHAKADEQLHFTEWLLKNDIDIAQLTFTKEEVLKRIRNFHSVGKYYNLPAAVRQDKDILMEAVLYGYSNAIDANIEAIAADKELLLAALSSNDTKRYQDILKAAPEVLKRDPDVLATVLAIPQVLYKYERHTRDGYQGVHIKQMHTPEAAAHLYSLPLHELKEAIKDFEKQFPASFGADSKMTPDVQRRVLVTAQHIPDYDQITALPPALRKDKAFAHRLRGRLFSLFDKEVRGDKGLVINLIKYAPHIFPFISPHLYNDPDVLTALFMKDKQFENNPLQYIDSDVILNDRKLMAALSTHVRRRSICLKQPQRKDGNWILASPKCEQKLMEDGLGQFFHEGFRYKDDREFFSLAVEHSPHVLLFASDRLRDDKELALQAVRRNGIALEFVSTNLQDDDEVVAAALKQNRRAFAFASERVRSDRKLVDEILHASPDMFGYLPKALRYDEKLRKKTVDRVWSPYFFNSLPDEAKRDPALVNLLLNKYRPQELFPWGRSFPSSLRADKAFMKAVVAEHPDMIRYATEDVRRELEEEMPHLKPVPKPEREMPKSFPWQ
jgi:hypothetical protein